MADPMKIRARLVGDTTEVKVLMNHEMETGQRKDAQGKIIPGVVHPERHRHVERQDGAVRAVGTGGGEEPVPVVQVQGRREGRQGRRSPGSTTTATSAPTRRRSRDGGSRASTRTARACRSRVGGSSMSHARDAGDASAPRACVVARAPLSRSSAFAQSSDRRRDRQVPRGAAGRQSGRAVGGCAARRCGSSRAGRSKVSLEHCDLGLGPGVVKGAYAQLPRYFADADRVHGPRDAARVVHGERSRASPKPTRRRRRSATATTKSDIEALVAYVTAESRGVKMNVALDHPQEARDVRARREDVLLPRRHARLRVRDLPRRRRQAHPPAGPAQPHDPARARRRPTRRGPRTACRRASCARSSGGCTTASASSASPSSCYVRRVDRADDVPRAQRQRRRVRRAGHQALRAPDERIEHASALRCARGWPRASLGCATAPSDERGVAPRRAR